MRTAHTSKGRHMRKFLSGFREFIAHGNSIGKVLTALLLFILTALALYLFVVLPINTMKARQAVDEEVPVPEDIALLTEIRDLLKK